MESIFRFSEIAQRMQPSPIRELFQLLQRPGMISFAGGLPDPAAFPVQNFASCGDVLARDGLKVLQYGASEGYGPLRLRTYLVRVARPVERIGAGALMVAPFVGAMTRVPSIGIIMFLAGFLTLATSTLVHLATLPTEFDASFARALPLLDRHKILKSVDRPHARRLLTAAALTYVAASLMSILNIARWWAILRR